MWFADEPGKFLFLNLWNKFNLKKKLSLRPFPVSIGIGCFAGEGLIGEEDVLFYAVEIFRNQ